jgi:putative acetyltransferase
VLIRRETAADERAARAVQVAAFAAPELDGAEPVEARLLDELRAEGDLVPGLSLVAVVDDEVVGHVVCSRARIGDTGEWNALGLGPIGVLPDLQRHGVGTALMHATVGAADALGWPAIVLLGDPGFYSRFGFEPAAIRGLVPPDPTWEPAFQVLRLTAWSPTLAGRFRYAAPFERL